MILSITCTEMDIREKAPIVFRGNIEENLRRIRAIGYDGVEMHIHDSDKIDRGLLKEQIEKNHLKLTSIGTGSAYGKDRLFFTSRDKAVREGALNRLCGHLKTAGEYSHGVVIIGLVKGKLSDVEDRKIYDEYLYDGLKVLAEEAEKQGAYVGLELMNRYESDCYNRLEEGLELMDKIGSDRLGLHIDTYHMNIEERDIRKAILTAGSRIMHVHAADNDRWYPGHGHYNFKETMEALKEAGYQHGVAVESFFYPDADTAAENALKELKKYL